MSDELILEFEDEYIGSAVSPTVDITETTDDITVTITDFQGDHSYTIEKTDQAIADAEQAATNANTAAANATATANQAAQYARTTADQAAADAQETADAAAGRADTAAASANQAAQAATQAAGTANTAAQNADAKAALADSKAALANQAAATANQAAEAAEAAKTAANTAAGQATTAAGNASTAAGQANTAATNADTKAQLADTAATNADTATQAANTATTNATNAAQAANNAADVAIEAAETITDGYFPKMLAGAAESLMGESDTATFAERVSTHDGVARIEAIQGNTVVWNQLQQNGNFATTDGYSGGYSTISASDNVLTAVANSDATPWLRFGVNLAANRKYAFAVEVKPEAGMTAVALVPMGIRKENLSGNVWSRLIGIYNSTAAYTDTADIYFNYGGANNGKVTQFRNLMLFDLTRMFGAGNEPATVEEFEAMFPDDYYPYNAGELLSVNIEGVNDREIPVSTYFPDGMKSAGSVHDELTATKAVKRVGVRAYQSGDESDSAVITDGANTCYALATPIETPVDPPLTMTYTVEQGGTESIVIPTGENSAAPTMAIVYGLTADGVVDKALSVIAPIEGATASTNYSVNAYLVHDQQLYRVTSAIATGEAITPGSNCVACTVMGELARLTA